jgi:hypothetical protein
MALKLKHIKINDRDIVRDLIIESWNTIYPNISLIDNSLFKGDNIICDLVGIRKDSNQLVYGFLEVTDHNTSLKNLTDGFNWINENQYLLNKAYSKSFFDDRPSTEIMVIASDFSPGFLTSLTYLAIPGVHLYQFFCMEVNGERGIILEQIKPPDKKISAMNNEDQRKSFNVCLACLGLTEEEEKDLLSPLD